MIMLNIDLHRNVEVSILKEIYSDPLLRTNLGFKGGTAAMLFYKLPRFSVDLDFNLLAPDKKEIVFAKLKKLLLSFGSLDEASDKRYTLLFILVYKKGERKLKIDVSKRPLQFVYVPKNYLGISMLVMQEDDMLAAKLSALITRREFASRDMFDLWFFLKNNWPIHADIVEQNTGLFLKEAFKEAEKKVAAVKKTELLAGMGDLLDNKQKAWAREKLQSELLFQLKLHAKNYEDKTTNHSS